MALCNVVITGISLSPNPVEAGKQFVLSVEIKDVVFVLGDDDMVLIDDDGAYLEAPDEEIVLQVDDDGAVLTDDDGSVFEMMGD